MPNKDLNTNEVIVNRQVIMSTRNDTVTPQTLVKDETATNKQGEKIVGELDPVSHDEAYLIDDPEGDIDESDYIPFYDVSDEEQPKKKTLFSSILDKLRSIFATKTGDNITDNNDKDTFRQNIHTLEWLGTDIPDNSDLDTYTTAGNYRVVSDASGGTIANLPLALCGKVIVFNNGNSGIEQFYFANHSPRIFIRTKFGSEAWTNWLELGSGGGSSDPHTYQTGAIIPANSDINTYMTEGVYSTGGNHSTISNLPTNNLGNSREGKLIVSITNIGNRNVVRQIFNDGYIRIHNGTSWADWFTVAYAENTYQLDGSLISKIIEENDDLNNLSKFVYDCGTFECKSSLVAESLSHCPVTKPFKMVVDKGLSGVRQTITITGDIDELDESIWTRVWNEGSQVHVFSDWRNITRQHTYETGERIPASSDLNTYTSIGVYQVRNNSDANTISNIPITYAGKLIVSQTFSDNNVKKQTYLVYNSDAIYVRTTTDNGTNWTSWKHLATKDDLIPHTYEMGTNIPANSDLDNYKTGGVYYVLNATDAATISNIPSADAGKLIVLDRDTGARLFQVYIISRNNIYMRDMNNDSVWYEWVKLASTDDISPSTVGDGYAVATVSGNAITATISGFKLRAGVIVALKISHFISTACTLDINNTGAKQVLALNNSQISEGYPIEGGYTLYTFIYDGTNYRILSWDATPSVHTQYYVANTSGNIVVNWGYDVNRAQIKYNLSNDKLVWNYYKNSAWRGDKALADYDDLGASVAKVGKSILPSWGYTANTKTTNGITYTFNPATGEITVNGTATADSYCILASANMTSAEGCYPYKISKGQYIITGCPSGGSSSKYKLFLQITSNSSHLTFDDYGNGCYVNFTSDASSEYTGTYYESWGIVVKSGQTLTNLVFKPMLRPAFTTAEYEPCEDIHKGNCYVGTCTTAGGTKDKVAYVDGYFVLRKGVRVAIKFTNSNTYNSQTSSPVTLNVNNTGAKNIWGWSTHSGAGNTGTNQVFYGVANRYHYYIYDGTYWVFDSHSGDNNNTNYLRNDASSVMTALSPSLALKASNIDASKADNDVTSTQYPAYLIQDKSGRTLTRLESIIETNGNISSWWYIQNFDTSGTSKGLQGLKMTMDKSGALTWTISTPDKFQHHLGFGYAVCSTAEATLAKTVTQANYRIVYGGIIVIKFDNKVLANSTLNVNSQGAKAINYRGSAITNNIILAGDRVTLIYNGGNYDVISIDRTPNYNDVIYKSYNNTATIKNAGVQTLEEITLPTGVWMATWREQSVSSALVNIAFGISATKKTAGTNFSVQDGYFGSFARTGATEAFTCSFPIRLNASTKLYVQHYVGGSTALTSAFGYLNITRVS